MCNYKRLNALYYIYAKCFRKKHKVAFALLTVQQKNLSEVTDIWPIDVKSKFWANNTKVSVIYTNIS